MALPDISFSPVAVRVVPPFALDRKYPNAATEWVWQFVFPASRICTDPRWGPPTRFHLHESVVQRAVAQAAREAGITKCVGPHTVAAHMHMQRFVTVETVEEKPVRAASQILAGAHRVGVESWI